MSRYCSSAEVNALTFWAVYYHHHPLGWYVHPLKNIPGPFMQTWKTKIKGQVGSLRASWKLDGTCAKAAYIPRFLRLLLAASAPVYQGLTPAYRYRPKNP
jgi:hypothetical protein